LRRLRKIEKEIEKEIEKDCGDWIFLSTYKLINIVDPLMSLWVDRFIAKRNESKQYKTGFPYG